MKRTENVCGTLRVPYLRTIATVLTARGSEMPPD